MSLITELIYCWLYVIQLRFINFDFSRMPLSRSVGAEKGFYLMSKGDLWAMNLFFDELKVLAFGSNVELVGGSRH